MFLASQLIKCNLFYSLNKFRELLSFCLFFLLHEFSLMVVLQFMLGLNLSAFWEKLRADHSFCELSPILFLTLRRLFTM